MGRLKNPGKAAGLEFGAVGDPILIVEVSTPSLLRQD